MGDGNETCGGWDVGMPPGGGGARSSRLITYIGVHLYTVGNHRGTGGMPPHIWALYQGGEDDRDKQDDDMVGLGRGTRI